MLLPSGIHPLTLSKTVESAQAQIKYDWMTHLERCKIIAAR